MRNRHRVNHKEQLIHAVPLDLHGLQRSDAMIRLVDFINDHLTRSTMPIEIIHGYGSSGSGGTVRRAVRNYLQRHSDCVEYVPGETIQRNPGITLLYPIKPLPTRENELELDILDYCIHPKTLSKIVNKFRRHGQPEIMACLKRLKRVGAIKDARSGRFKAYQACFKESD